MTIPGSRQRYPLRKESPLVSPAPSFRIDYRNALNPAQYEAVTTLEGPLLVIAGAGSGKTHTLVYRVARLVEEGVSPGAILLLTFTRRAAQEMLRRAATLLDGRCEAVMGGTFHAFANLVLRRHAPRLGLSQNFTILDRSDAEDVINLLRTRLDLDKRERRFPKKGTILEIFSLAANRSSSVGQVLEEHYPHLLSDREDLLRLQEDCRAYKAQKSLLDYDDLLLQLKELLETHPEVAGRLSRTYRYIMVDEYQDTNRLQAEIVRLLAATHDNVMAVGDEAQSIYSFRGANFRNIMDFPTFFPGTRIVKIEENYRSTQPILDLCNAIIHQAKERYTKNLFTRKEWGTIPLLVEAENERYQSRFVAQKILELREEGVPLSQIAVLFRSSFHAFDLELELNRRGIPFVKRGGFKFVETAHVKDVLAHLRVLANPQDAVSWNRVLLLLEGVGPKASEAILTQVLGSPSVTGALEQFPVRAPVQVQLRRLAGLFAQISARRLRLVDQLEAVIRYYTPILQHLYRDDYPRRQKDLEHFVAIAERYRGLTALLTDMALEPPSDSVGDLLATEPEEGRLTLSTIHSAKGLEWHSVFVIWTVEGRFPPFYSLHNEDEIEEERRLMYVATTRARENLFVAYPINIFDRATGLVLGKPSRFLEDLPDQVLEPVVLVEEEAD
ncbi:MAG: ATP-dependent helicase [Candidatus Tectomicrobia bacterium]|uniref:DNA 3'-5' helicase n=1 Tax=Tectimicrobiota bacterium TaxID=2528274 RepID=A0A932G1T6_UNCTE|nr:ATP-dependent helicase [Candidatus Tectomicrobia bacterium]